MCSPLASSIAVSAPSVESLTAPSHLQIDHARHDTLRPVMAKPSVDSFRAEPLLQQPFVRTSITNIGRGDKPRFFRLRDSTAPGASSRRLTCWR